jgi:CRISPR-associated protein Cst1
MQKNYIEKINLTGNPFVDTGIAVLAAQSGCEDIDELTLDHLKKVHGDGEHLAVLSYNLKSTSMIFTTNCLVLQNRIAKDKKIHYYSKMTTAILSNIGLEDIHQRCESCGNQYSLDLDRLFRRTLVPLGYKDGKRFVGRDWFPLAGSMGSDAQALPSCSRSINMCAKCLFAVQYLPLGVILIRGRLTLFQSTSKKFWYQVVKSIADEINERVSVKNDMATLSAKEGSAVAVRRILLVMQRGIKLDPGTSFFMWMFSNAGTGADCEIDEIPNFALLFLDRATKYGLTNEIMDLLHNEKKTFANSLLYCISKRKDYQALYPYGRSLGVSPKLFLLYQLQVRNYDTKSLATAYAIAKYVRSRIEAKKFDDLKKDIDNKIEKQNVVRKIIVLMVAEGLITFNEYYSLFSRPSVSGIKLNYDAWKLVRYHMHHIDGDNNKPVPLADLKNDSKENEQESNIQLNRVIYAATALFNLYVSRKGIDKFQKDILDRIAHRKVNIIWLRNQFAKLAEQYDGFTYDDWKYLCMDEEGKESVFELLYLFRLVWTEWIYKQAIPVMPEYPAATYKPPYLETDISQEQQNLVKKIADGYIDKKGLSKFEKYVLQEIRSGKKGLHWFREQFGLLDKDFSEDKWENLLKDKNGKSIAWQVLFQFQLLLANYFRQHTFKVL